MRALTAAARTICYATAVHSMCRCAPPMRRRAATPPPAAPLLEPDREGVFHRHRNEVTSLGVQVHGGMGFIEETGAAQHYRMQRITAIYGRHQRHPSRSTW